MAIPWKVRLLAVGAVIVVGVACQEASTGPATLTPQFHFVEPPQDREYCRMMATWGTSVRLNFGGGSVEPCSMPINYSPNFYWTAANPQTLTFTFSRPVTNVQVYPYEPVSDCPAVHPTVTAYDSSGAVVATGQFSMCSGGSAPMDFHSLGPTSKLVITAPEPILGDVRYLWIYYSVPCPPTGDSILDDPATRDLLRNAWDNSNANDPIKANRRERGGAIYRDPTTQQLFYQPTFNPTDTPCTSTTSVDDNLGTLVAIVHTHPFTHGEETTGLCPGVPPTEQRFYDAKKYFGPSDLDIRNVENGSAPRAYVIDKDNIYAIPPGTTLSNFATKIKSYSRVGPFACTLP